MKTVVLILLFSCRTFAEVPSHVFLWGGATADLISTRAAIHRGAHEANPFAGQGWKRQAAIVYSMTGVMELVSGLAERAGHPQMAKIARYLTGGMHVGATGWNAHVWSRAR